MKNSAFIKLSTEEDSAYEDIYTTYGVSFIKGSYIKLLNTSKAKEYVKNESRLSDGTQYLASADYSKISERTVALDILFEAETMADFVTKYEDFMARVSNGLIYLKIPTWHRVFKLVYTDITPRQLYRNKKAIFALSLTEPNPSDRISI